MTIAYTMAESGLGWLLVAATERGVCWVALGDEVEGLVEGLRRQFPRAEVVRDDGRLEVVVEEVMARLKGDGVHAELPLDVGGSAFQLRVWEELRRIPPGRTLTYGQLARSIGRPTAARAVARACATNPLAIITPCHRVIRGNGGLAGYRWGVERKRLLLAAEACSGHTEFGS